MSLTIDQIDALNKLYPTITHTIGDIAYDADGNEVAYDLQAVTAQAQIDAELVRLQAKAITDEQAQATAKASALAKLTALGLTADEIAHLIP